MKTILAVLIFISLFIINLYSQDTLRQETPFKFNKQTGKWETTTAVVQQYYKDMVKLQYQDKIILTKDTIIANLKDVIDTLQSSNKIWAEKYDLCEEKNLAKDRVIFSLTQPVTIKQDKPVKLIEYIGLYPFVGTMYDFTTEKLQQCQFKDLKFYGGIKWVWQVVEKVLIDLRAEYPPAIKLETGLKF